MSDFKIHILGAGAASPSLRHAPSCTVVEIRGTLYMVDCGEGAQRQMMRMGLKFSRLSHIFLTHLHGDHILGLPGLLSTMSLKGYDGTLTIHTFAEGIEWIKRELDFLGRGTSFNLQYEAIDPNQELTLLDTPKLTVRNVILNHSVPAVGFIFQEKAKPRHIIKSMTDYHNVPVKFMQYLQKGEDFIKDDGTVIPNAMLTSSPTHSSSYAHISDTAFIPSLAEKIGRVDLLYHETTYQDIHASDAAPRGHSTASQAAEIAKHCGAGKLLTGHYSSRYKDETGFLKEAATIFPNVIIGQEGMSISL